MRTIKLETSKEKVFYSGNFVERTPQGEEYVHHDGKKIEVLLSDKEMLTGAINTPFQEGFTPADVKLRTRLMDKVDEATDSIDLEDAEYATVCEMVARYRFGICAKAIDRFCDKFNISLNP